MKEKAGRRRKNGRESGKRGKKKYRSIKVKEDLNLKQKTQDTIHVFTLEA